jgi:hypothetical protein
MKMKKGISRRNFIKLGAATAVIGAGPGWIGAALANRHPHPRPTSIKFLDRNMYRKNTDVLAHFEPGALTHPDLPFAHPTSSFSEEILAQGVSQSLNSFGVTFSLNYHTKKLPRICRIALNDATLRCQSMKQTQNFLTFGKPLAVMGAAACGDGPQIESFERHQILA